MFCPSCGAKNADSSKFCETCGAPMDRPSTVQTVPVQPVPAYTPPPVAMSAGTGSQPVMTENVGGIYSKIAIVIAIIAIFVAPFILGPIAIILGYIGYKKGDTGTGKLAMIIGVICTILGLILSAIAFMLM